MPRSQAAAAAFEQGSKWRKAPAAERSRLLNRLADLIEEHGQELAELESLDNGKPVTYARQIDVPLTVAHFRYFAGWPTKIEGEVIPVGAPNMLVLHAQGAGRGLRARSSRGTSR